jgi:hypothetical protein
MGNAGSKASIKVFSAGVECSFNLLFVEAFFPGM